MQHVLETSKRAFSAAVAAATIAFSIGAGVLVAPATTHAASAGDRIKSSSLSTVYYYGYDGMRYTYPNEKTYKSWHMTSSGGADFSGVQTISDSAISDITLGGNVVVRPGTYWIKIQSDNKVYAVARDGSIHWIESADVAQDFAGSDWNKRIIDVPDVFFTDYTVGASLMTAAAYDGMLYEMGGATYLAWDGEMREVSSAGMSANGLSSSFVLHGSGIDDSALSMGSDVTSKLLSLSDAAQTETSDTVVTGDLMVSAASSMPASASLPAGANAVEVFRFNAKAGSEDASLDDVALTLTGAGATTDISAAYLYKGDTRLTEARTVNSSTRMVTFTNLGQTVSAGQTATYTVRVTVSSSATAANTFGFKLADDADVTSGGNVSGSFPISGNIFTITGASVGTLTITKTGSITDPQIGEQDAEIGHFKATASGSEGAAVKSITLKIDNAADHSDFRLWDGSTLLANGVNAHGDLVTFDLSSDPYMIAEGGNNIFTVSADIGGQDADSVKVYVDNTVDIVATGTDYGFGLTIDTNDSNGYDGSSCTSSSGKCSYSTVVGGELTISFNGPSAGDIQVNSQDQTLLAFSMSGAQDLTIKNIDILVYGDDDDNDPFDGTDDATDSDDDGLIVGSGTNVAAITDIKLVNADTGAIVAGPYELDGVTDSDNDAVQTINFLEDWTLNGGETLNLELRADIDDGVTSGTEFGAALDISGLSAEDQNGDALSSSDIVPGSDITGYAQQALAATLAFSLASSPTSLTTVDGTDNVEVLGVNATAGNGSDVTITYFVLSAYGDGGNDGFTLGGVGETGADINDVVESCSLYYGSTLLAGPEAPTSAGTTIIFDTIDWTIPAGQTLKMIVKCNFANTSDSGDEEFSFDLVETDTDVIAEDEDGDVLATTAVTGEDFNGNTSPNVQVTLADSGSLAITVSPDMPSADFVLGGSSNNFVSSYRVTATNEAFKVSTLTFTEEQATDDALTASAYANNIGLVTITYPKADGTTGSSSASMSSNSVRFTLSAGSELYVAPGTPATVKVYVDVPGSARYSGGSSTSNEKIRMAFSDGDNSGTDSFKAVGVGSGETLGEDASGIVDLGDDGYSTDGVPSFVVRETKPTITLAAQSPSGSAVVGRGEVLRFNVAAAANQDVVLDVLTFKLTTTDNAGTGTNDWNACDTDQDAGEMSPADFDLYNLTVDGTSQTLDNSTSATQNASLAEVTASTANPWTLHKTTGAICDGTEADVGFVRLDLPTGEIVPKGQTYSFALYLDSTGASASQDDSIRVDLPVDPIVGTYITVSNASNESALAATDTTLDVDAGTAFALGDVIVYDAADDGISASDERMLVTGISTNTLTVVRGYLGTTLTATADVANTDDILRLPGSMLWQDDGTTAVSAGYQEYWGSYLVDNLMLNGNTLTF